MATPEIFYKNYLRIAHQGITDGYGNFRIGNGDAVAWNTSGFDEDTDISNRRYKWDTNTPSQNANYNNDITYFACGASLYFLTSGRVYQSQNCNVGGKYLQVEETPNTRDENSSWEIHPALLFHDYSTDWAMGNGDKGEFATNIVDNTLANQGKTDDDSSDPEICVALPNLVQDASFGEQSIGNLAGDWEADDNKWQIAATASINHYTERGLEFTSAGADPGLKCRQWIDFEVKKGKTYRLTFFAISSVDTGDAVLSVFLKAWRDPNYTAKTAAQDIGTDIDSSPVAQNTTDFVTFNSEGSTSFDTTTTGNWFDITYTAEIDAPGMVLEFRATEEFLPNTEILRIECVTLTQDTFAPDTFILGNHNLIDSTITLVGAPFIGNVDNGGTSMLNVTLINADSVTEDVYIKEFTNTAHFPNFMVTITKPGTSNIELKMGQMWITEKFTMSRGIQAPHDPDMIQIKSQRTESRAGVQFVHKDYESKVITGSSRIPTSAEATTWLDWYNTVGNTQAFWYRFTSNDDLVFVINQNTTFERAYNGTLRNINLNFKEQK